MKKAVAGLIVGLVLGACGTAGAAGGFKMITTNDSLSGGRVEIGNRKYNRITYTTVNRGGLWCEMIGYK